MTGKNKTNNPERFPSPTDSSAHQIAFLLGATAGLAGSLWAARRISAAGGIRPPLLARWQRRWSLEIGAPAAARRADQVRQRYADLMAWRTRYDQPALRMHLAKVILPGLAAYQILLEEGLTQTAAIQEVTTCLTVDNPQMRIPGLLTRIPRPFAVFRPLLKQQMRWMFPPEGWSTRWLEDDDQKVVFHIYRCFYLDVLRGYHAAELTPAFCQTDDVMADGIKPAILFQRSQTLGRGGEICDFCYTNGVKNKEDVSKQ